MIAELIPVCLTTPSSMLLQLTTPLKSKKGGVKQEMPVNNEPACSMESRLLWTFEKIQMAKRRWRKWRTNPLYSRGAQ